MVSSKNIISQIEKIIGKPIPVVEDVERTSIGVKYNGSEIEGLSLNKCELKSIPEQIKEIKSLQYLSVSSNQIEIVPEWISDLKLLQNLNFNNNKITQLPTKIGYLQELRFLNILENPLDSLPTSIRQFSDMYSNFKRLIVKRYGFKGSSRETIRLLEEIRRVKYPKN
ncbi:MAG: hypothetical protein GY870_11995 [archaeon]|nr:hypothetical protein [archaeon]